MEYQFSHCIIQILRISCVDCSDIPHHSIYVNRDWIHLAFPYHLLDCKHNLLSSAHSQCWNQYLSSSSHCVFYYFHQLFVSLLPVRHDIFFSAICSFKHQSLKPWKKGNSRLKQQGFAVFLVSAVQNIMQPISNMQMHHCASQNMPCIV